MKLWNTRPAHHSFASDGAGGLVAIAPERPAVESAPVKMAERNPAHEAYLDEYAKLATLVGIKPLNTEIERFKAFLVQAGITVFNLAEVRSYMDEKAAKEAPEKAGWHWRPLRSKDARDGIHFGRVGRRWQSGQEAASDYYHGQHDSGMLWNDGGNDRRNTISASSGPYDRTIPLHALRKVALIERAYKGDVAFFVSDYAPAPQMQPDPFLMALVPNPDLDKGEGRFVIDVWDEPGFGIERMLKAP